MLDWFRNANLKFVRGVPSTTGAPDFDHGLLVDADEGTPFQHLREQLKQIVTGNREGGFFLMIARKGHDEGIGVVSDRAV